MRIKIVENSITLNSELSKGFTEQIGILQVGSIHTVTDSSTYHDIDEEPNLDKVILDKSDGSINCYGLWAYDIRTKNPEKDLENRIFYTVYTEKEGIDNDEAKEIQYPTDTDNNI